MPFEVLDLEPQREETEDASHTLKHYQAVELPIVVGDVGVGAEVGEVLVEDEDEPAAVDQEPENLGHLLLQELVS